ncbi:PqqD family protein [Micrococcus luteus]|uniref:PqqD family protein n=1 Tax=Micrococcus luteus TaxID=1270 RepID=UPI003879FE08
MTVETTEGWTLAPDIAWARTPSGQAAVMTLEAGQPLLLSTSGGVIWDALVGGRTPEDDLVADPPVPLSTTDVTAQVAEAFGLEPADVAADVHAFLEMLEAHGILVRVRTA